MSRRPLRIAVYGATGRMARQQHLENALIPIREEGGMPLVKGGRLLPEAILVGRNDKRLAQMAQETGIENWSSDLDAVLADPDIDVYFDAAASEGRELRLATAVEAGKHIYAEKPVVNSSEVGAKILKSAEQQGIRHGVVEDKLHLPGMRTLRRVVDEGSLGPLVSFKLDFGYWVYDGVAAPCQRSSWNYRAATGGGIIFDMFPHWRYLIEGTLGPISAVVSTAWTATPQRLDEAGQPYTVDVEDTAQCLVLLESGAHGLISSSWADRPRRDDVLTLRVDGADGAVIAGGHRCYIQTTKSLPKAEWDPDRDLAIDYLAQWSEVAAETHHVNPFRRGWESFLRHLVEGAPFDAPLQAGIRDVRFAEIVRKSAKNRGWVSFD